MITRALTIGSIVAGILSGIGQAYPNAFPAGDYFLGWTAIILGASSLLSGIAARIILAVSIANVKRQLLSSLPKERPVELGGVMGDSDSQRLASEILEMLKRNGFSVNKVHHMHTIPFVGVQVEADGPISKVAVGKLRLPS